MLFAFGLNVIRAEVVPGTGELQDAFVRPLARRHGLAAMFEARRVDNEPANAVTLATMFLGQVRRVLAI